MRYTDILGIIPPHYTGSFIETDATVRVADTAKAKEFYEIAKARLLDVNNWHQLAGVVSAGFRLTDAEGNIVTRHISEGDHLKIDIPGPGSSEGNGFDWVLVERVREIEGVESDTIGFRVRPSDNPLNQSAAITHFYGREASSSFIVMRRQLNIIAWIVDHNLKPNGQTDSVLDKLRHVAVGLGAIGLFSKLQWQGLADGIVRR